MNRKVSVCYLLSGKAYGTDRAEDFDQRNSDSAILNARLLKNDIRRGKFGPKIRKTSCLSVPLVSSETKYPVSIGINEDTRKKKTRRVSQ